ncbi:MAG TPA: CoA transferase, partial [Acetobacteraceae bacterium]|nr:CoA transferase [Acetobacteraceae bacterium]
LRQVFEDPQVQARGMAVPMRHPVGGDVTLVANPMRLSETPVSYRSAPPLLGEHTREVLGGLLGLDAAALDRLAADGVI